MADPVLQRERRGRSHFARHRLTQIRTALLVDFDDASQQFEPLFWLRDAEGPECALGRGDRLVDIRLGPERDLRETGPPASLRRDWRGAVLYQSKAIASRTTAQLATPSCQSRLNTRVETNSPFSTIPTATGFPKQTV